MKNSIKTIVLFVLIGMFSLSANYCLAQKKQKFGHINSDELLQLMPGRDSAISVIQQYAKTLETQLTGMQNEFETKYNDYLATQNNMTELIRQTKAKELQDMQARIEAFQVSAEEDLQKKQEQLLQPIIDKAKAAIDKVAEANGYTYIFDTSLGIILFSDPTDDILPLVKIELGIK